MQEIERRFLLSSVDGIFEILRQKEILFIKADISQFYINITKNSETRLRKIDNKYIKTIKKGFGLVRDESENFISKEEFDNAVQIGQSINKTRYSYYHKDNLFCIDSYHESFALLEIEFKSEEEAKNYKLPYFYRDFIKKEITNLKIFTNKNLALFELNFLKLKKPRSIYEVEILPFTPQILALGVKGIQLLLRTKENEKAYINSLKTLKIFEILFSNFNDIVDTKTKNLILFELQDKQNENIINFFDFLNFLEQEDEEVDFLISFTKNLIISEKRKNLSELFSLLELIFNDISGFYEGDNSKSFIKKEVSIILRKKFAFILKISNSIDNFSTNEYYESLFNCYHDFYTFYFLYKKIFKLDDFEEKSIENVYFLLKKLNTYLTFLKIIDSMINNIYICEKVDKVFTLEKLKTNISYEIYRIKCIIISSQNKYTKLLSFEMKKLKFYTY